jgi:hypothetical protein
MMQTAAQRKASQQRIAFHRKLRKDLQYSYTLEELVKRYKEVHQVMEDVECHTGVPVGLAVKDYAIALRVSVLQIDRKESDKLERWIDENSLAAKGWHSPSPSAMTH